MTTYARGTRSIGECQRCGFVYKLDRLRQDGENNLLVCATCYDIKHPAEEPVNVADAMALRRPAPDLDEANANALDDDRPIGVVLGMTNFFGEQS